ncbi:MAG TPA: hypothetical protein VHF89_17785 [Solirubrobacteraceae bacterium]|nr:hypothetical protein [Solirubrobacteraceae bacterium]
MQADDQTHVVDGVHRGRTAVFRLHGIDPSRIRGARVRHRGGFRSLPAVRVRMAARTGKLRVLVNTPLRVRPGRWVKPKLLLKLADEDGGPSTTPPAPATDPVVPVADLPGIASGSMIEPTCHVQWGGFGNGVTPPACWRPYSPSSPFNKKLPPNPRLASNSNTLVNTVVNYGPLSHMTANNAGTELDWGHPIFWSKPTDPVFTIHCLEQWGKCDIEGKQIRIPDEARPAGGSDGHMTVVDQATGMEYDMWQVKSKPKGGGVLTTSWGGMTSIDGDGLGSDAVAAQFGTAAGKIRAEELEAGRINHALFLVVKCDSGKWVYPATKAGGSCAGIGLPTDVAPPMGAHFMLDMSPQEIAALNAPQWKKTILTAMAEYGMFVGDTGGDWGIKTESGLVYTAFGKADKFTELYKKWGANYHAPDDVYTLNLREGIDWKSRLRVVDPCVSQGTC